MDAAVVGTISTDTIMRELRALKSAIGSTRVIEVPAPYPVVRTVEVPRVVERVVTQTVEVPAFQGLNSSEDLPALAAALQTSDPATVEAVVSLALGVLGSNAPQVLESLGYALDPSEQPAVEPDIPLNELIVWHQFSTSPSAMSGEAWLLELSYDEFIDAAFSNNIPSINKDWLDVSSAGAFTANTMDPWNDMLANPAPFIEDFRSLVMAAFMSPPTEQSFRAWLSQSYSVGDPAVEGRYFISRMCAMI